MDSKIALCQGSKGHFADEISNAASIQIYDLARRLQVDFPNSQFAFVIVSVLVMDWIGYDSKIVIDIVIGTSKEYPRVSFRIIDFFIVSFWGLGLSFSDCFV